MSIKPKILSYSTDPIMDAILSYDNPFRNDMIETLRLMGSIAKYHEMTDRKKVDESLKLNLKLLSRRYEDIETKVTKVPEKKFPIQVMYLHENRNLIGKNIGDQEDFNELVESSFVKAYWEINSLGAAIQMLLQAAQLDANPEQLVENYNNWKIDEILDKLDDKAFTEHVQSKKKEWETKVIAERMSLFERVASALTSKGDGT